MLHISALTYRLGERLLIDNASAALASGAHVGLVGRNGAGKTTLFRLIRGELAPEGGAVIIPKGARVGSVEQEAPAGEESLVDFVLSADVEREALTAEAETASDPERIAEIHTRLVDIEAHNAPARAARILKGLGFDEAAQARSLGEFSGGWRMRVALAAVLFSQPDLLLLDEPTNYLDLEGVLWLTDYLKTCPATILVISHDRDLLDDVAQQILHLDRGKLTLWSGGYTSFERQRREQQILAGKAAKKQEEKRAHLQAFVDRFRAKASKAVQAQSRLKMLAKMEPIAAVVDDNVQPFKWPPVAKRLSPPIVTMDKVSAGYDGRAVIERIDLSLADDDRIGLLGQNGNGKSTFAKLIAGRLEPMARQDDAREQASGWLFRPASDRRARARRQRLRPCRRAHARGGCIQNPRPRGDDRLLRRAGRHQSRFPVRRREGAPDDGSRRLRRAAAPHPRRADQPSRYRQSRRIDRGDQRL